MPNQHSPKNRAPRRCRQVRFTDAEWAELQKGAQAIGETRSEAVRAGSLSRVRQAIPDASDVTVRRCNRRGCKWPGIVSMVVVAQGVPCGVRLCEAHAKEEAALAPVSDVKPSDWTVDGKGFANQSRNPEQPGPVAAPIPDDWTRVKAAEPTQIFACAYCPAEFTTEFDAEAHIDNLHPEKTV